MLCPGCGSENIVKLKDVTNLGYDKFRCRQCLKEFNERTGGPFNRVTYRTEVVSLVCALYQIAGGNIDEVVSRVRDRGFTLSRDTVRQWVSTFTMQDFESFNIVHRQRAVGYSTVDSVRIKNSGRVQYLYRCFNGNGDFEDAILSDQPDLEQTAFVFMKQRQDRSLVAQSSADADEEEKAVTAQVSFDIFCKNHHSIGQQTSPGAPL